MWAIFFALITGTAYGSANFTYPPQKISLRGISDIQITGVRGALKMSGKSGAHGLTLRVRQSTGRKSDDWHLEVRRHGQTLKLEVYSVTFGRQWRKLVAKDQWPEFDMELIGEARPVTVGWREGTLEFSNWNADLEVSFLKGRVEVSTGRGQVSLHPMDAQVVVRDHTGPISIQGGSGPVYLARNRGDLDLNWLSGPISLLTCRGDMKIAAQNSLVNTDGGGGSLNLQLDQGTARIAGFQGRVDGRSERAKWDLAESAPADVNVRSATGPVGVRWKTGGAKIFLTSSRGPIYYPTRSFLRSDEKDGQRIVKGVKRDKKGMGQVFVRTDSGPITWSNSLTD